MPGRRLNDNERHLLEFWNSIPTSFPKPILRQVKIEAEHGLRGIQQLAVPLGFPITALCGRNGVGKSTVLALSALSARPAEHWVPYWSNTRPKAEPAATLGYSFKDFFARTHEAQPVSDVTIGWVLVDRGTETEHRRRLANGRWQIVRDAGRQNSRSQLPIREIDFMPIARVLPPAEILRVRNAFRAAQQSIVYPLNDDSIAKLSYIMGKPYRSADTRNLAGLSLQNCHAEAAYSGFDMGAGECALITLFSRLQTLPLGGLMLIEEIELGLHPEAQQRLVHCLVDVCWSKKLQILCTTHSEVILDSLPRSARILLRKLGNEHEAIANVSTRFAIQEMTGSAQPELMIYAEDQFAAVLIQEALPGRSQVRVVIRDVGDKFAVARQGVAHLKMNGPMKALSVFDGDCSAAEIRGWIRAEHVGGQPSNPEWLILPGNGLSPERWVVQSLRLSPYRAEFARQLNCSEGDAANHVDAMWVQLDAHDSSYVLERRTGLSRGDCRHRIIRSVARQHPELEALRTRVNQLLENR